MQPTSENYKGHRIEVRPRATDGGADADQADDGELIIDDRTIPYGRLPDGQYFIHEYAYDWSTDLPELARRLVDHREQAAEVRRRRERGRGE